jgi:hypothetical protein
MQRCYFTISMENSAGAFLQVRPRPKMSLQGRRSGHGYLSALREALRPQDCFAALAMTNPKMSLRGRRSGRGNLSILLQERFSSGATASYWSLTFFATTRPI